MARDRYNDVNQLLARVQAVGRRLVAAQPRELVIGNIVRRVLGLIRDEAEENRNDVASESGASSVQDPPSTPLAASTIPEDAPAPRPARPPMMNAIGSLTRTQSMFNILADPDFMPFAFSNAASPALASGASTPVVDAQSTNVSALRSEVIDGINDTMDEVKQVDEQVQSYSDIILHPGDFILVHQPSKTVQRFISKSKRKFTVLLVTDHSTASADDDTYATFRKSLATTGSIVVTVMNSGLTAYMSRVTKVILDAKAIMGNGGVIVDSGAAIIARAAQEQGRVVIVLGGVYKLSPDSQADQDSATEWGDPSKYVNYADGQLVRQVHVRNAVSEYIPAELVNTYITNL